MIKESLANSYELPKYGAALLKFIREVGRGIREFDPLLGKIQVVSVYHGGRTRQVSEPRELDTPLKEHSNLFSMDIDTLLETRTEPFCVNLWNLFQEMNTGTKKHFYAVVSDVCDVTGNAFGAAGKDFWESHIEMLETMELAFDKDGNLRTEVHAPPDVFRRMQAQPPTPEQQKRIEEVISAKRSEHFANRRQRRLR